jgi:hypothetical protein
LARKWPEGVAFGRRRPDQSLRQLRNQTDNSAC